MDHYVKPKPIVSVFILLACIPMAPALAEAQTAPGGGEPAAPVQQTGGFEVNSFSVDISLGIANCFDNYVGGHGQLGFGFKINPNAHLTVAPSFSGGYDGVRDLGVYNWLVTVGYRHFGDLGNSRYVTILAGPTTGYWINNDNGEWIAIGGTMQVALMMKRKTDWGIYAGFTMVQNASQVDEVDSEFDVLLHAGVKLSGAF